MSLSSRLARSGSIKQFAEAALLGASSRYPLGTNVFTREWDLLVILDTCRYDALALMEEEFEFVDSVGSITSVGSSTREWAANTYTDRFRDEIGRTAMVCGNANVTRTLKAGTPAKSTVARRFTTWNTVSPRDFLHFESLPGFAPLDPYTSMVTPDIVTDRAIDVGRTVDAVRLVVHYIAPHYPYRSNLLLENRGIEDHEHRPFDYLNDGGDREVIWSAYLDDLRWVLQDVETLLENVDAERAVITADHGELFGHFGLYSHPTGVPHPRLRTVPWMETEATDTGTYEPHYTKPAGDGIDADTQEHLEQLGYL